MSTLRWRRTSVQGRTAVYGELGDRSPGSRTRDRRVPPRLGAVRPHLPTESGPARAPWPPGAGPGAARVPAPPPRSSRISSPWPATAGWLIDFLDALEVPRAGHARRPLVRRCGRHQVRPRPPGAGGAAGARELDRRRDLVLRGSAAGDVRATPRVTGACTSAPSCCRPAGSRGCCRSSPPTPLTHALMRPRTLWRVGRLARQAEPRRRAGGAQAPRDTWWRSSGAARTPCSRGPAPNPSSPRSATRRWSPSTATTAG